MAIQRFCGSLEGRAKLSSPAHGWGLVQALSCCWFLGWADGCNSKAVLGCQTFRGEPNERMSCCGLVSLILLHLRLGFLGPGMSLGISLMLHRDSKVKFSLHLNSQFVLDECEQHSSLFFSLQSVGGDRCDVKGTEMGSGDPTSGPTWCTRQTFPHLWED